MTRQRYSLFNNNNIGYLARVISLAFNAAANEGPGKKAKLQQLKYI